MQIFELMTNLDRSYWTVFVCWIYWHNTWAICIKWL